MTDTRTPADVLEKAAEIMEQRGKTHKDYEDSKGRVCAIGALRISVYGVSILPLNHDYTADDLYRPSRDVLSGQLREMTDNQFMLITTANDLDLVDMPNAFRLAAERWRRDNEEQPS